jgi:MFS family permease
MVGGVVGSIPTFVLSSALPQLAVDLGSTEALLSWAITAPLLAGAVAMPVLGKLGDLYGHRKVFLAGLAIATVTSLLTPFAWDAWSFIALRVLTQVAGFAIQPSGMAILAAVVPRERLGPVLGTWSFVAAAGPAMGLVIGGVLMGITGWWAIFVLQGTIAAIGTVLTLLAPDVGTRRPKARFDLAGAATLGLAVFGLILALNQVVGSGWDNLAVQLGIAAAVVGGVAFWLVERGRDDPFVPPMLARNRPYTTAVTAQFFTQAATFGTVGAAPALIQGALGYSASTSSLLMLCMPIPFALVGPYGGRLAVTKGQRLTSTLGTGMMTVGMLIAAVGGVRLLLWPVLVGIVLLGLGNGLCRPGYALAAARAGGEHDVGIAMATERMFNQIGSATGVAVLLAIAPTGDGSSFAVAMLVAAAFTAAALAIAATLMHGRQPATAPS